jgi:hypothetical protein
VLAPVASRVLASGGLSQIRKYETLTKVQCMGSWVGGGAGVPHGRMPACNGGGGGRKVGPDTVPGGSDLNLLQI